MVFSKLVCVLFICTALRIECSVCARYCILNHHLQVMWFSPILPLIMWSTANQYHSVYMRLKIKLKLKVFTHSACSTHRNKTPNNDLASQRPERLRSRGCRVHKLQPQTCQWTGDHTCSCSASVHTSHHGPSITLGTVHLSCVEVCPTIMSSYCKQVPTQWGHAHTSTAHMHGLHKFPSVCVRVISVSGRQCSHKQLFM